MKTNNTYTTEISTYWNLIKDVKDEIKIRLITLLSESLTNTHAARAAAEGKDEATENFIRKYYGAWKGDVTAEEIIAKIQEGKTCKNPISFD